ncbi:MAG TPA: hypothetical protein VKQ70_06350, partial [Caulobacteraceae bacterium]|nr:hypothetical protein [Caulobacteraceae bacterium]
FAVMRIAAEGQSGRAAILAMLDAAAGRQLESLALCQAIMSALWTPGLNDKVRRRLERRNASALVLAVVQSDLEPETGGYCALLVADMIWDAYLATLRRAALDGLTLDQVKTRVHDQTKTILSGMRRA